MSAVPRELAVAFLGDSLTEGFGVAAGESFAEQAGALLRGLGRPLKLLNEGVSGDTSADALRRLRGVLGRGPDVLVVEVGVNDFFWGVPIRELEANLRSLTARGREGGALVLLADIRMPPGFGRGAPAYSGTYARVAADLTVPLLPFPLDEVVGDPALVLGDGIHPNGRGHRHLAEAVVPALAAALAARNFGAEAGG